MLFGHHMYDRLQKGEDVFYFCFDFLQYITHSKFSLATAVNMRAQKRVVQDELEIERSATPTPVTKTTAAPTDAAAGSAPVQQRSALTTALQSQQAANKPLGVPPMRKASSDGSGSVDARGGSQKQQQPTSRVGAVSSPGDGAVDPIAAVGSGPYSPGSVLHSLPPASSSYTAAKPASSLASFIIDGAEHGTAAQTHTGSTPAAANSAASVAVPPSAVVSDASSTPAEDDPSPADDDDEADETRSPYKPSAAAVPIPLRKASSKTGSRRGSRTAGAGNGSAAANAPHGSVAASASSAGAQMSRANSWTFLSSGEKHSPPIVPTQPIAIAAPVAAAPAQSCVLGQSTPVKSTDNHLRPPTSNVNGSNSVPSSPLRGAAANGPLPPSSSGAYPYASGLAAAPPSAASRAASARRCDRLLEVRSLFMMAYHHVLPATVPAAQPPHARATSFAHEQAAALAAQRASTSTAAPEVRPLFDALDATSTPTSASDAYRAAAAVAAEGDAQPTRATSASAAASPSSHKSSAAPVAQPATRPTSTSWFGN
jgi:hypothetical protein